MEDLIDFNGSPKVNSKGSGNFSLLVPIKSSTIQNDNTNKNHFDTIDKSIDFSCDPFELELKEKSISLENGISFDTENLLIFDEVNLKSLLKTNNDLVPNLGSKENTMQEFVIDEKFEYNVSKPYKISLESNDIVNKKTDTFETIATRKNENEGILIDFDEKMLNTIFSDSDSNNSTPNSDRSFNRLKNSKSEIKNRLLKLSLSNALIQSPLSRRCSVEGGASPESSIFNEAAKLAKQLSQMCLDSSSPKKTADDSCDNIMEINPNWIDSESDISKDLELLKIPMLEKIGDNKQNEDMFDREYEKLKLKTSETNSFSQNSNDKTVSQRLIDINTFREKLKQHDLNSNVNKSNESIDSLISNLKDYVLHCGTNPTKKDEAEKLLDNLSCLLKDKEIQNNEIINKMQKNETRHEEIIEKVEISKTKALIPPKPIIRQGTFDIELENNKFNENEEQTDSLQNRELNDEKITSISPTQSDNLSDIVASISPSQSDNLSDIVEQISKLVGGVQNINVLQTNLQTSATTNTSHPTYIVVMSTPGKNILNHSNVNVKRDELAQVSPDQKQFRRRSYSLTLPNKNLINKNNEKQTLSPSKECNSFKTPMQNRYLSRRNSISSSTPQRNCNNNLTARRSICENFNSTNKTAKTPIRSTVISTQKLEFDTTEMTKNRQPKCMMNLPNDINSKRFRLKSSENVSNKGPLKATVQINSIVPIKTTSLIKNPPMACSTPMIGSPKKSPINGKKNYSRFSTTPNSRRSSNLLSVGGTLLANRRKSFSDSSTKTIGKPTLGVTTPRNIKKTFEKPITINKLKMISPRLESTQPNKENKHPKK